MLRDVVPLSDSGPVGSFVRFIEERLGGRFYFDISHAPLRTSLEDAQNLARSLFNHGSILSYYQVAAAPDEPPVCAWAAQYSTAAPNSENVAGGSAVSSDAAALTAALAEALERHVWYEYTDYFKKPARATVEAMLKQGPTLGPERFAGFSPKQREGRHDLHIQPSSEFLWIQGYSWVSRAPVWLPAQVVSGSNSFHVERRVRNEPSVIHVTTNGLATSTTREGAVLHGALELIERDAYMIMWLNQLSLPRFELGELRARSSTLDELLAMCGRYRLRVDAIRLITDAPTYAVCAVVTDETGNMPTVTLGLKAHKDPARAVEGAVLEALRGRSIARHGLQSAAWDENRPAKEIGHLDRALYWTVGDRAKRLSLLTEGPVHHFAEPWEQDTDEEHLARIVAWCQKRDYALASVSLTNSNGNPTPLHIEMVVMPELQPMHLFESGQYAGGERLREIPRLFGYAPRAEPFLDEPHPFI